MADREGLGNLPIFDTEIRTSRELIAQEQRQEDDYQYIIRMYSALAREILDQIEDACDQMEAECLTNIWIGQCFFQWQIRFMIR